MRELGIDAFVLVESPSNDLISFGVPIYQKLLGMKHWKATHCVLYFLEDTRWTRVDLTWDGINENQFFLNDESDCIVEEENYLYAFPVQLTFGVYKRYGWLKALALMDSERIRFSPVACVTMLLGKKYPWFNCASFISFILFASFIDTPSELVEKLIEDLKV